MQCFFFVFFYKQFLFLPKKAERSTQGKEIVKVSLKRKRKGKKEESRVEINEERPLSPVIRKRRLIAVDDEEDDSEDEDSWFNEDEVTTVIDKTGSSSTTKLYEGNIHSSIDLNTSIIIDVTGDGFCGFRCIANEIFGDQEQFWKVKMEMRDVLLKNAEFYRESFSDFIEYDRLKKVVCFGIEEIVESTTINWSLFVDSSGQKEVFAPSNCWFYSAGCTQLAADTFRRPVAAYSDVKYENNDPVIFFPFLNTSHYHITNEGSDAYSPMPIILQNIGDNHWITFKIKRSIKMLWPRPHSRFWEYATTKMGKALTFKRSLWYATLNFLPKFKSTPARIEDAIGM